MGVSGDVEIVGAVTRIAVTSSRPGLLLIVRFAHNRRFVGLVFVFVLVIIIVFIVVGRSRGGIVSAMIE